MNTSIENLNNIDDAIKALQKFSQTNYKKILEHYQRLGIRTLTMLEILKSGKCPADMMIMFSGLHAGQVADAIKIGGPYLHNLSLYFDSPNSGAMSKFAEVLESGNCPSNLALSFYDHQAINTKDVIRLAQALKHKNCASGLTIELFNTLANEESMVELIKRQSNLNLNLNANNFESESATLLLENLNAKNYSTQLNIDLDGNKIDPAQLTRIYSTMQKNNIRNSALPYLFFLQGFFGKEQNQFAAQKLPIELLKLIGYFLFQPSQNPQIFVENIVKKIGQIYQRESTSQGIRSYFFQTSENDQVGVTKLTEGNQERSCLIL